MTGRLLESIAGVHTFTARQSSDCTELLFSVGSIVTICGQAGAKSSADRTSRHGLCSTGGRNLNAPTGGSAKGMPRNTCTPCSHSPRTGPEAVITMWPPVPAEVTAMLAGAPTIVAAAKKMKKRRFLLQRVFFPPTEKPTCARMKRTEPPSRKTYCCGGATQPQPPVTAQPRGSAAVPKAPLEKTAPRHSFGASRLPTAGCRLRMSVTRLACPG